MRHILPRYYFDIEDRDGRTIDGTGVDLPDLAAAESEARKTLAELAREEIPRFDHSTLAIGIREGADDAAVLLIVRSSISRDSSASG